MTIKSILCIFGGAPEELASLDAALTLGKTHGAQVRILHISPDPAAYAGVYGEAILVSSEIIAIIERESARLPLLLSH